MRAAAARARHDRLGGALFVVAAAEALPSELDGLVDELRLHFPWGSLLRGLLDADQRVLSGMARLMRPGAVATTLLSVTARDASLGLPPLCADTALALAAAYAARALALVEWRLATASEVAAAHSTWAKRLGVGRGRDAWLLALARQ
jgi:16S rRNA (adenine(1408)-N(1))-methyltransferase